jgi:hypothetical protein
MFSHKDYIQHMAQFESKSSSKMELFKLPKALRLIFSSKKTKPEQRPSSKGSDSSASKARNLKSVLLSPLSRKKRVPNPAATFLGCPGEIRNQIYSYVLGQPSTEEMLKALQVDRAINPNTQLAMVCSQIYHEIREMRCPSFLVVPKHELFRVKTCAGLTMPINEHHKIRMMSGPTTSHLIRNLVLRDYLHNIILYWRPPDGLSGYPINLQPSTIYFQLCICESVPWISQNPSWISTFSRALENLLNTYDTITRVVIYYCGLTGNQRFPSLLSHSDRYHFPKLVADGILGESPTVMGLKGCMWVAQEADGGESGHGNSFVLAPVEGDEKRIVTLDCFDSSQVCGKRCVLA